MGVVLPVSTPPVLLTTVFCAAVVWSLYRLPAVQSGLHAYHAFPRPLDRQYYPELQLCIFGPGEALRDLESLPLCLVIGLWGCGSWCRVLSRSFVVHFTFRNRFLSMSF